MTGRAVRFSMIVLLMLFTLHRITLGASEPQRKADLDRMLKILPKSEAWQEWLQATGELPPDFSALPSIPYLPDPLRMQDGNKVSNPEQWRNQRQELMTLIQYYITGTPPPAPGNVRAAQSTDCKEGGLMIQETVLEFGPEHKAKLNMRLIVPGGEGPFPVFITQDNHYPWALIAASRGYIGCVYAGADSRDDTGAFVEIWPDSDWTKLTRRAWAASRCIDYLETLDFADTSKICLTGHSRNGKLSIIGGYLDERITAVISSSSGAGGANSYRLFAESHFGEGIELLTRAFPDWMHPRLRFFAGRENKLPVDQHSLIACTAPRACLISTALNDPVESVWAVEHTYRSAKRVYELLGNSNALQLRYRWGSHETQTQDIEAYLDWLDLQFGYRHSIFEESKPLYPTYDEWLHLSGETIDPQKFPKTKMEDLLVFHEYKKIETPEQWKEKTADIQSRIRWAMGKSPSTGGKSVGTYGSEYKHISALLSRDYGASGIKKKQFNFGNYIAADLYYPAQAEESGKKIPGVIWLHPLNTARGYNPSYRRGQDPHLRLAQAGFAVLAFDQIGNGYRLEEITHFYDRYPLWSLMGKMVSDTQAAYSVFKEIPFADSNKVYLAGYDMGAKVALHAAALDTRFAGIVSVAGFTPMRLDTQEKGTGGIARWSQWLPMLPRLGAFVENEPRIPYDYNEVLGAIAPRPVLVVSPALDLQANQKDIEACVESAKQVYAIHKAENNLQLMTVEDYNRFSPELQDQFIPAIKKMAGIQ